MYLCSISLSSVNIDCLGSNPGFVNIDCLGSILGLGMISSYNDFITASKLLIKQNLEFNFIFKYFLKFNLI